MLFLKFVLMSIWPLITTVPCTSTKSLLQLFLPSSMLKTWSFRNVTRLLKKLRSKTLSLRALKVLYSSQLNIIPLTLTPSLWTRSLSSIRQSRSPWTVPTCTVQIIVERESCTTTSFTWLACLTMLLSTTPSIMLALTGPFTSTVTIIAVC